MKICEVNDIASVATELADGLKARGHDVQVIRPRLIGGTLPWSIKPVVGPVRAVEWAQIISEIRRSERDFAHIHYAYLGMIGALGNIPYLLHCHGSDVREITPFTRPLVERAIAKAGHVFYATPDLATYVLARRPDATFLPNPVDAEKFRPIVPSSEATGVYICCGLTDIKGALRLLDACRRLAAKRPEITITAIAGGPYTEQFAALPNVRLVRHANRDELPERISKHAVVMGQVFLGAAGMAELESVACARPVITWFRHNRAYPEPSPFISAVDGFDIALAVERLIDDPARRDEIGNRGRAWIQRYHSVEGAALAVEQAAERILGLHPLDAGAVA